MGNWKLADITRHTDVEKGVPLVAVVEILGQKTMAVVRRYSHRRSQQKARVITEVFKDLQC